jgi:hypothetical protein
MKRSGWLVGGAMLAFQVNAAPLPVMGPEAEPFVVQTVQDFADRYDKAANDMAKGAPASANVCALRRNVTSQARPRRGSRLDWHRGAHGREQ